MQFASLTIREPFDRIPHHAMLPPRMPHGSPLRAEAIDAGGQKRRKYGYSHTRDATEGAWVIPLAAGQSEQRDANRNDRTEQNQCEGAIVLVASSSVGARHHLVCFEGVCCPGYLPGPA